jgi:predicted nucleotidyltransferase
MSPLLTVEYVRTRLAPVMARYPVLRAIVFGSVARGEPSRRSDVDLIVVMETDLPFLDRHTGIRHEICTALDGPSVDLLIYTPEEMERMAGRRFIARALAEGKVIYERQ